MNNRNTPTSSAGCGDQLWLLAFVGVSLAIFWPARHAGFVVDWLGWQMRYEAGGWADVPRSFGYQALQPVLQFGNYLMFRVFGTEGLPWYLLFATLHGTNGWMLYRLMRRLLQSEDSLNPALAAGFLFLLSPYAAETVVWRVCLHYLLSCAFMLGALHAALDYFETGARRILWRVHGLFVLGLFSFEWSLAIPILLGWLLVVYTLSHRDWTAFGRRLVGLLIPPLGLLGGYFALNKWTFGNWVGHYGASTHLNVDPQLFLSTMLKYFAKYSGFVRYYEHPLKVKIFGWFDAPQVIWGSAAAVGLLAVWWLWKAFSRKTHPRWQWAGFGLGAFFISLLPVANLFFYYLQWSENDRYGYFASAFFWMSVALVLSALPRWMFSLITTVLIVVSGYLLLKMNRLWGESEKVYAGLVQDFRWYDRDEVIIMASPDNLKGVWIMRIIGQDNGFNEALALRRRAPYQGKMWEVAQFNMETPNDGVKVEKLETDSADLTYKTLFAQFGNWWFRNGIGASDYETTSYIFRVKEWHVETTLREARPNRAVIYPVGGKWVEAPQ
ncbi:MAG: hypothetical protein DYG98_05795 [Haliscomenobacteraceae bacterium CHB4]|nr:hypothetical protein [Haliscomenobacteraceae bacterium CHB4]